MGPRCRALAGVIALSVLLPGALARSDCCDESPSTNTTAVPTLARRHLRAAAEKRPPHAPFHETAVVSRQGHGTGANAKDDDDAKCRCPQTSRASRLGIALASAGAAICLVVGAATLFALRRVMQRTRAEAAERWRFAHVADAERKERRAADVASAKAALRTVTTSRTQKGRRRLPRPDEASSSSSPPSDEATTTTQGGPPPGGPPACVAAADDDVDDTASEASSNTSSRGTTPVCPVCFDALDDDDVVAPVNCDHRFHRACLVRWIDTALGKATAFDPRALRCPTCATSMLPRAADQPADLDLVVDDDGDHAEPAPHTAEDRA